MEDVSNPTLDAQISDFRTFQEINRQAIAAFESEIETSDPTGDRLDDFLWDQVAEMKSHLGAEAANSSSDDDDDQEDAIAAAEKWVTDNVSNSDSAKLAAVLWLNGIEEGTALIRQALSEESK